MRPLLFFMIGCCCLGFALSGCKTDAADTQKEFAVTIRLAGEPDKLLPFTSTHALAGQLNELLFGKLATFSPSTLQPQPMLITALPSVSPIDTGAHKGGTAYAFAIQPAATWDNGSPVTAADYIFTLKFILNPAMPTQAWRGGFSFIKDVVPHPTDPKQFTVIANERYMLAERVCSDIYLLPAYHYDPQGLLKNMALQDLADEKKAEALLKSQPALQQLAATLSQPQYAREKTGVVGAGPYQLSEWVTGDRIVLTKKKNWWGDSLATQYPALQAYPDRLVYKVVKDLNTAVTMLKEGSLDVCGGISPKIYTELEKTPAVTEKYALHATPSLKYFFIAFNEKNPKLNDARVRRALAHLMDVEQMNTNLLKGLGTRLNGPILPNADYYAKDLAPLPFDVAKAQNLLTEAGWKDTNGNGTVDKKVNGQVTELEVNVLVGSSGDVAQKMVLQWQEAAKKAGVGIKLDVKEQNLVSEAQKKRQFDATAIAASLEPGLYDPYQYWHTDNNTPDGSNRFGFGNAASDKLIEELRATLDKGKRDALYQQFQQLIYNDQPAVWLVSPKECVAISKRLSNAAPSPLRPHYHEAGFRRQGN